MEGAGRGGGEASYEATDFGEAKRAHDKGRHARHTTEEADSGGRAGGAEACRLPRPCRLETEALPQPCPVPSCRHPQDLYPTCASITRHRGGGLSRPHSVGKDTEIRGVTPPGPKSRMTGWESPPAQVCRGQGSPVAVSPRREGDGWGGSLPPTWIRRSLPRT